MRDLRQTKALFSINGPYGEKNTTRSIAFPRFAHGIGRHWVGIGATGSRGFHALKMKKPPEQGVCKYEGAIIAAIEQHRTPLTRLYATPQPTAREGFSDAPSSGRPLAVFSGSRRGSEACPRSGIHARLNGCFSTRARSTGKAGARRGYRDDAQNGHAYPPSISPTRHQPSRRVLRTGPLRRLISSKGR